ncbi:hypothetical protein [Rhodoflexus caldus]|uniref:hypothetical protein n=1 Tax=Rhodoflexus caldus TaxID=2891236 RepID=UPI00202A0C86|nr:hypothetical protein [Rhodoflexus caldus]
MQRTQSKKTLLGSIRREPPNEMPDKKSDETERLSKQNQDAELAKKAKKALKLLKDGRFKKP